MGKIKSKHVSDGGMGWVLFMGWIGAVVYFVERNEGFWGFILALLQASVWPAYVLRAVLNILGV